MQAAIMGRTDVARILVKAGADLNARDSGGETPLMHALAHSHLEVADVLRTAGARE